MIYARSGIARIITLRNGGATDLVLGSITKDSTDSGDFAVSTPATTVLPAGTSMNFTGETASNPGLENLLFSLFVTTLFSLPPVPGSDFSWRLLLHHDPDSRVGEVRSSAGDRCQGAAAAQMAAVGEFIAISKKRLEPISRRG